MVAAELVGMIWPDSVGKNARNSRVVRTMGPWMGHDSESDADTDPHGFRSSTFFLLWLRTVIVSNRHTLADRPTLAFSIFAFSEGGGDRACLG